MKTTVTIPDDLFKLVKGFARRARTSQSRVFSDALKEYLARHAPGEITETMNQACAEIGDTNDSFVSSAARRIAEQNKW
jgi:metal-responsive CopG/Arc/MetJ family transcriptional regulator